MSNTEISQAPVQTTDNQNFDVDIEKIYQNYIVEIDKIRSHVSVQNNPSLNTLTTTIAPGQSSVNITMDQNPQESRCHAFYRLLGLPITDGNSLYTPGFDNPNNGNQTLNNKKITIAQNLLKNLKVKDLLDKRENIPRDFLAIFSVQDVEAMVLVMSLAEVRSPLNASFNKISDDNIFDTNLNNISYSNDLNTGLMPNVQNNGRTADPSKVSSTKYHILNPLIVDPRIDFNIFPKRNRIAVPFLKDKTETMLSKDIYLKRPYIEKVCRDRFDTSSKSSSYGTSIQNMVDNIKNIQFIKDDDLIQQAFGSDNITSEVVQFSNYFNSIRSVLIRLNQSISKIMTVLSANPSGFSTANYNWTPIPNTFGPEYGSKTRDLLSGQATDNNNTDKDKQILTQIYKQGLANISNKLTTLQTPNLGGFAFDGTELTPDNNSSDSFGDLTQNQITELLNSRQNETDAANDATRTIEIIMGEFSGLGLLDILIISAAFWIIDKKYLLGLLDDTAIDRMMLDPNLQAQEVKDRQSQGTTPDTIKNSILNFQNTIKDIYAICAKLWEQIQIDNSH